MTYIGLDPSFKGFGISMIHDDINEIDLCDEETNINTHSTTSMFESITDINKKLRHQINIKADDMFIVGQEVTTTYGAFMEKELYALDFHIWNQWHNDSRCREYNLYSQEFLKFIIKGVYPDTKKLTSEERKRLNIFFVEDKLLSIFKEHGYKVNIEKLGKTSTGEKVEGKNRYIYRETITSNEADSFIYAVKQFVKHNPDSLLTKDILHNYPRFMISDKELK